MKDLNKDDYDHVESIMFELFRMRRGKLVKLADSIKLNSDLYNKLTVEEAVFYKSIYDNSVEFENKSKVKEMSSTQTSTFTDSALSDKVKEFLTRYKDKDGNQGHVEAIDEMDAKECKVYHC